MANLESIKSFFNISNEGLVINLIAAVSIILVGLLAGYIVSKLTKRILHELELNKILKDEGVKIPLEEIITSFVKYIIYFIALIFALSELGLETIIFSIILGTVLLIMISFIVLAFKDFIPNITAGFFIHQQGFIKKGDRIRVKEVEGIVMHIDLTEIRIKLDNGDLVYLPNSLILKNEITKIKKDKQTKNGKNAES